MRSFKRALKMLYIVAVSVLVFLAAFFITGCDTLGNGKIDLPVDVSVEWQDNFGNRFVMVDGSITEATYRSLQTGIIYELTEEGGFLITAPDGTKVRIRRRTEGAESAPVSP
ncbi:hypothetical protein EGM51_10680 [Verrucomicrobia bacterium S94]|nr:hypothetical protein EGM51_10680 [Verrucomicrobia bacterium S94]